MCVSRLLEPGCVGGDDIRRVFFRPFGGLPADFTDFPVLLLLLLLWPCQAKKAHLAPVTDHIKAISCFQRVILVLMVNGVVVHVCVCMCVFMFACSQVALSSEMLARGGRVSLAEL